MDRSVEGMRCKKFPASPGTPVHLFTPISQISGERSEPDAALGCTAGRASQMAKMHPQDANASLFRSLFVCVLVSAAPMWADPANASRRCSSALPACCVLNVCPSNGDLLFLSAPYIGSLRDPVTGHQPSRRPRVSAVTLSTVSWLQHRLIPQHRWLKTFGRRLDELTASCRNIRVNHPAPFRRSHAMMVADAIFRGWLGEWRLQRNIDNRHPSSGFSGRVIGRATFVPSSSDACRYREDGLLHRPGMQPVRVHRDYVYVYDRSEDRLSVHFAAGANRGALMCHLRVLPQHEEGPALRHSHMPTSWRLQGVHPCGADTYRVMHHVSLAGTTVQAMEVVYEVSGPTKEYTSWAEHTRPAGATGGLL